MRVELLQSLEEAWDAWEALFAADDRATPFSSPGWARAWWPHWADGAAPFLLLVSDGDRSTGLAPFFLTRRGPFRQLRGLGTIVGNYWDVVAAPGDRAQATAALLAGLDEHAARWDTLVLDRLPSDSATTAAIADAPLRTFDRPPTAAPALPLPGDFDAFLKTLPSKKRTKLRRHLRRLDEGELNERQVTDPDELAAAIDTWRDLRVRWWRERGLDILDEHASDRFRDFTAAAVGELVPRGLMSVMEMTDATGAVVGVSIDLLDDRAFYYWLDGFDPAIAKLGPGTIHIAAGIRESIAAGRGTYDFMVGQEPYKYEYGAKDRLQPYLVIGNRSARSRAALAAARAADRLRGTGAE